MILLSSDVISSVVQGDKATGSITLSWSTSAWPGASDLDAALAASEQQRAAEAASRAAEELVIWLCSALFIKGAICVRCSLECMRP